MTEKTESEKTKERLVNWLAVRLPVTNATMDKALSSGLAIYLALVLIAGVTVAVATALTSHS